MLPCFYSCTFLLSQLSDQTSQFTVISDKLEKEVREKAELSAQLLELKGQLRACDREVTIVSHSFLTVVYIMHRTVVDNCGRCED